MLVLYWFYIGFMLVLSFPHPFFKSKFSKLHLQFLKSLFRNDFLMKMWAIIRGNLNFNPGLKLEQI